MPEAISKVSSKSESKPQVDYRKIVATGLWTNNPALVQLLGLCPLLAVSNSFVNALGLGLATIMVLVCSNTCVSLVRKQVPNDIRVPIFILMIATFVTTVDLLMQALAYELYLTLGIFIPLIVTNCAILGRAEAFASKNNVLAASLDGLMHGVGFAVVLMILGGARELIGQGTLFAQLDLLLGDIAQGWVLTVPIPDTTVLLALLPAGAFIVMGLLIAAVNLLKNK